ncbi:siderophore-interacting protein [Amycolatopsis sp. CA-230715]|uniref:siderophore-interacting protein n=1 Tax=Amycolatopsis sp. CA-230715 TaxID=2745196 RepID=UPI001C00EFB3|nr:siderophore-interacting protein [Amycolatopsis sp. CA-230715]QWF78187.1 Vibriobactin utilization protein ViuB [Amycolatopsis sp. CA-230715]
MALLPKRKSPDSRRPLSARVVRTERTSEHFVTITIGGEDLADFAPMGADQWFRFFFPREGQRELRLPTSSSELGWMAQTMRMGQATRPWVRNYTVRAFRRDALELDIEFVAHGDASPGSAFATRAEPGDDVGLLDEGISYLPPEGSRQLLVADESALPAALAILDGAPADLVAKVLLEVPSSADIRKVDAPDGVEIRWLPRDGDDRYPGRLALETLATEELPASPYYAWIAGESGLATGARRFLNRERGVPKSDIAFLGYWRTGRSAPG